MDKRNAIITGASRGLGKEISCLFVQNGYSVLLCARKQEELLPLQEELKKMCGPDQRIAVCAADVSVQDDVDRLFSEAERVFSRIDVLVNNAGIQGPIGPMEQCGWEKWKHTVDVDLLGPAYMIYKVLPYMKKQSYGKIINLSGGGATGPRVNYSAYAVAKTGVVRLTETIAKEVKDYRIDINAIAPGAMNSRMLEETLAAGESAVGADEYAKALRQKDSGGTPPVLAAELCLYLAGKDSDGITGKLISAVWDDWKHLNAHRERLVDSDIYTLRRIVPHDRGEDWGDG